MEIEIQKNLIRNSSWKQRLWLFILIRKRTKYHLKPYFIRKLKTSIIIPEKAKIRRGTNGTVRNFGKEKSGTKFNKDIDYE